MELEQAKAIALELLSGKPLLKSHFSKFMICGSIRRNKAQVGDIDIVAIVKPECEYIFGEIDLSQDVNILDPDGVKISLDMGRKGAARFLNGDKIKRFMFNGVSIDLYLADEYTFGTLVLIRTGSTEHNIKLVQLARKKGLKLFASGKGLCEIDRVREDIIRVVENTEDGILQYLLGKVPTPEERV